jgi:thiamine-monophosphate kinase
LAVTELGSGREFDLIRAFLAQTRNREHPLIALGPGDDCAIIAGLAVSTDLSVEDVHFRRAWLQPAEIGYRAVVAALSDLAAMAAEPIAALVSFAIPPRDVTDWAIAVMEGANQALDQYDTILAGGDVTRSSAGAMIDVVVIGKAERPVLRSTARPGDEVWVTGTLGGAAAAVAAWLAGSAPSAAQRERYAHPAARIREAIWLREHVAPGAMIDLSDGLGGDAHHIAAASGCRLIVDAAALPVHPEATQRHALRGGEDYELCFCAARGVTAALAAKFETDTGVKLTRIGEVVAGDGMEVLNALDEGGFDHFTPPGEP